MEIRYDRILLTTNELIKLGCTEKTLRQGILRNQLRNLKSWSHLKANGRLLVYYDSIPTQTRKNFVHPSTGRKLTESDLRLYIEDKERLKIYAFLDQVMKRPTAYEVDYVANYEITKEETNPETGEIMTIKLGHLKAKKQGEILQKAVYYKLMDSDLDIKALGFKTVKPFRLFIVEMARERGVKLAQNYRRIQNILKAYRKDGIDALIPRTAGKSNNQKIGTIQEKYLLNLYADPRKFDMTTISHFYNHIAQVKGWKMVGEMAVRNLLTKPENIQATALKRHGKDWFIKNMGYTMRRKKPSIANALWVSDGTKVNYFYHKNGKTMAKLNVYAIMDANSEFFVGWHISEEAENSNQVREALKQAFRFTNGKTPHQFLYDNGNANVKFWRGVQDILHFPAQPNNPQSKTVEKVFDRLQNEVMRKRPFFTGQNITAKSIRSRHNPEHLKQQEKENQLPTLDEVIQIAHEDFHIWNNQKQKRDGKSPKQRYESSEKSDLLTLSKRDEACLFWEWKERSLTYRKDGITTDIHGQTYCFEALSIDENGDEIPDIDFHTKHCGRKFAVKYNPDNIASELAVFTEKGDFVRFFQPKILHPMAVIDYEKNDRKRINQGLEARNKQLQILEEKAQERAEYDAETIHLLGYQYFDKETLSRAESDMITCEKLTDRDTWKARKMTEPEPKKTTETKGNKQDVKVLITREDMYRMVSK